MAETSLRAILRRLNIRTLYAKGMEKSSWHARCLRSNFQANGRGGLRCAKLPSLFGYLLRDNF